MRCRIKGVRSPNGNGRSTSAPNVYENASDFQMETDHQGCYINAACRTLFYDDNAEMVENSIALQPHFLVPKMDPCSHPPVKHKRKSLARRKKQRSVRVHMGRVSLAFPWTEKAACTGTSNWKRVVKYLHGINDLAEDKTAFFEEEKEECKN